MKYLTNGKGIDYLKQDELEDIRNRAEEFLCLWTDKSVYIERTVSMLDLWSRLQEIEDRRVN